MNKITISLLNVCLALTAFLFFENIAFAQKSADLRYYDVKELELPILGKGFDECGAYYSRLPLDIHGVVRDAVWNLGQNTSGLAVRFNSDSKSIGVKWKLLNSFNMYHMAATGIRGLDLYTLEEGKWLFVGTAQPYKIEGSNNVCRAMMRSKIELPVNKNGDIEGREYLMYLPLYDGVVDLEIGVDSLAKIELPKNLDLVPQKYLRKENKNYEKYSNAIGKASDKPIVFYGTSVTQGGCASRPGMSYTSIVERNIHNETINLGFSGNGRMDKIMADKISLIDAKAFFIDCLANCTYDIIRDSAEYFIRTIAGNNPKVPVYLVSNYAYPYQYIDAKFRNDLSAENLLWYSIYKKLRKSGYKNLYFINVSGAKIRSKKNLGGKIETSSIGPDHEGTVDGVHMTDLGFIRFARIIEKVL